MNENLNDRKYITFYWCIYAFYWCLCALYINLFLNNNLSDSQKCIYSTNLIYTYII